MLDIFDYLVGWAIYIVAGTLCYVIFYRFTGVIKFKPLANCLRAVMIAVMFTPWYVSADDDLMAPALMVVMLDMVTIGGTAFVRPLVPLTLSVIAAIFIVLLFRFVKKPFQKSRP